MPAKPKPPAPTIVLLVRHGQTPTTGKVLPGRAPGLHLADKGREQADGGRRAHRRPEEGHRRVRVAARAHARDGRARSPSASGLRVRTERGLLECDFGDWTGAELKKLYKLPEWRTVQQLSERLPVPRRASRSPRCRPASAAPSAGWSPPIPARRSSPCPTPIPSRPRWPARSASHLDLFQRIVISPCSISAILYTIGGPAVLTVNETGDLDHAGAVVRAATPVHTHPSTWRECHERVPPVHTFPTTWRECHEHRLRVRGARPVHRRHRGSSRRAGVLPPGAPAAAAVASLRLEKQQVAALAEYLGGLLADLPAPAGELPTDLSLIEPVVAEWVDRLAGRRLPRDRRPLPRGGRGADRRRDAMTTPTRPLDPPEGATARLHLTREQVAAFVPARRRARVRRSAAVPDLRATHRPRRPRLPPQQRPRPLSEAAFPSAPEPLGAQPSARGARRRARSRSRAACRGARTAPSSPRSASTATGSWRSTSRCGASARCGTSRPACTSARWRPTSCPRRWAGTSCRSPCAGSTTRPLGEGSLQLFVDADFEAHYFTLLEDERFRDQLETHVRVRPRHQLDRPQGRPRAARRPTTTSTASTTG